MKINRQEIPFNIKDELSENPRITEWLGLDETSGDQLHVSIQTMTLTSEDHHVVYFIFTCDSGLELRKLCQMKPLINTVFKWLIPEKNPSNF